jgi:thioredoxin-related protein
MKRIVFFLMLVPFLLQAQDDKGVHFEHGLSWAAVKAKAKAENKYIFMDCYTTWCGPCKYMASTIFPMEETGKYMNDKFVSVGVQLDTTAKDDDGVKSWYADGHDLATTYHIRAYPTYLVFAPDGHVIHRFVGSSPAPAFITNVGASFDSTKQYYTLLDEYDQGRRDTAFLHRLAMSCSYAYDLVDGQKVANDWLATQEGQYNHDILFMENLYTNKSTDKYFAVFTDHAADVDKVLGPGVAEQKVRNVYISEGADRKKDDTRPPDWAAVRAKIATRLPDQADELTARIKINYFRNRNDWPGFEKAIVAYMKTYGQHITDPELNDIAWSVFQRCPDMTCVSEVLDWSKRLKDDKEPAFMDTYANILYKLGKKDDAIALETKAADMAGSADEKSTYQATIDKMKKGEKTWD